MSDEDLDAIPGWFDAIDRELFRWFLGSGREISGPGHLVELGSYMGQSAVLIGDHLQDGETFTIIDLFEAPADDEANSQENSESYAGLSRQAFERYYRGVHPALPTVVQDFSERIVDHVEAASTRFMHVDASHLYEHVVLDIAAAKRLLATDGVVVFDDFRSGHTPGVAAAVWSAVATEGLRPIVVSPNKLYATWGEPAPYIDGVATTSPWWTSEVQDVSGGRLLILSPRAHETYRWIKYLPPAAVPGAKKARARLAALTRR
ncbi:class I SAM-dependent methyltransferase [Nocardioides hwasunensis]|uniref:Class I SAM-dependent methyltransferase n=1 Tax=Nocardioides hwasunensis TaxID=397258 RepID=A0ABR8MM41_9ACTN|nr:class I SAM-dependent methyltransferase [Nocardioides hwasunensis]MBD3917013.1 class I SAM-dependent methyltransferase [Nocardioides hwasunensis]